MPSMSEFSGTPAVPEISTSSTDSTGSAGASDFASMYADIAKQTPLPSQYITGSVPSQPTLRQIPQVSSYQKPTPTAGMGRAQQNEQRKMGGIGAIISVVGQAKQQFEQQKQNQLKTKLVDVMQAKQNVANATTVLNDPNADANSKAMAQKVYDANKKNLNTILNDPKNAKALAKALDISYVDPEKNKTPEVQAGIAAAKEVKAAGVFNASNPQDAKIAEIANQPKGEQPTVTRESRADAALAKDAPTLQNNPAYTQALAERKELTQYALPKLIAAQEAEQAKKTAMELQAQKDAQANDRELSKEASALQLENIRQQGEYRTASLKAGATLSAARLRSDDTGKQMAKDVYNQASTTIKDLTKSIVDTRTQLEKMDKDKTATKDPDLYKANQDALKQYQTQIQEQQTQQYQANLIMQGDPQASTVRSLLGNIAPAVPASH